MDTGGPKGRGPLSWTFQDKKCAPEVVSRLAFIHVLDQVTGRRFDRASGHIWVSWRCQDRLMKIIDIGAVVGQAHIVRYRDRQLLVNHWIDLKTFNNIY